MCSVLQEMAEEEKYTCPVCTRALQKRQRQEQRRMEAEAAAEIEREAREAQAARKAKLVSMHMPLALASTKPGHQSCVADANTAGF